MADLVISSSRVNRSNCPAAGFTHHGYPFSALEPVHSHAYPHFVIYNAGEKLASMDLLEP